ncbi:hypothetical protein CR513_54644, partial [Mucuna pruriens]
MVNRGSKKHNMSSSRGEELLKEVLRKGTIEKGNNVIESKESKKNSICGHNKGGKELLKVVTKGTEKLSIKESKCKSGGTQSRMCFCAPTTHEGSFKCRLHRKNKTNLRFASVPCAQVGTDHVEFHYRNS